MRSIRKDRTSPRKRGYADIVFLRDAAAIDRVIEAERSSDVCAAFFSIMTGDEPHRVYQVLKTYG